MQLDINQMFAQRDNNKAYMLTKTPARFITNKDATFFFSYRGF